MLSRADLALGIAIAPRDRAQATKDASSLLFTFFSERPYCDRIKPQNEHALR
jgi:hypothetical protein